MHNNMAHGVLGVSNATPHTTELLCMQDRYIHAAMVTAQERHCHVSTEEAERCAPVNCSLMTSLPQDSSEGMMGNLHHVAETATVAMLLLLLVLHVLLLLSR